MDLLLHLVKQHEVDIHEIAIASILKDYLQHLDVLRALDLSDLGDFIVMASTLMEIKSRELLPREEVSVEAELDPRDDLIRRLLEYKRYRDISRRLERMAARREEMVPAALRMPKELGNTTPDDLLDMGDLGVWHLTEAFARLLDEVGQETMHVEIDKRGVGYYTERVLTVLKAHKEVRFEELFSTEDGRGGLIGVLIALLEMMKQGYLRADQPDCNSQIMLAFTGNQDLTAAQVMAGDDAHAMEGDDEDDEDLTLPVTEAASEVPEAPAQQATADDDAAAAAADS